MSTIIRYLAAIFACYLSLFIAYLFFEADAAVWYLHLSTFAYAIPLSFLIPLIFIVYSITGIAIGRLWSSVSLWHAWVSCAFLSLFFSGAWIMFLIGYHAVFIALCMISWLCMMVIPLFLGAWEIERRAFYLFIPYFVWVLYALYFTAAVWMGMGR